MTENDFKQLTENVSNTKTIVGQIDTRLQNVEAEIKVAKMFIAAIGLTAAVIVGAIFWVRSQLAEVQTHADLLKTKVDQLVPKVEEARVAAVKSIMEAGNVEQSKITDAAVKAVNTALGDFRSRVVMSGQTVGIKTLRHKFYLGVDEGADNKPVNTGVTNGRTLLHDDEKFVIEISPTQAIERQR